MVIGRLPATRVVPIWGARKRFQAPAGHRG